MVKLDQAAAEELAETLRSVFAFALRGALLDLAAGPEAEAPAALADDEKLLLDRYRACPAQLQQSAHQVLERGAPLGQNDKEG